MGGHVALGGRGAGVVTKRWDLTSARRGGGEKGSRTGGVRIVVGVEMEGGWRRGKAVG
jgi:hypothetical protein